MTNDGMLLSDDLLFTSRILEAAKGEGLVCAVVKSPAELIEQAALVKPCCILLDLQLLGNQVVNLIGQLKNAEPAPALIGFGPHVDTAMLRLARQAGCNVVLPRSKFLENLGSSLIRWFGQV